MCLVINRLALLLLVEEGEERAATVNALGEIRSIFDFVLYMWAGLGAIFGPAMILTLMWRGTTA